MGSETELARYRAFVAKECVIWLTEPYAGSQMCLGCGANTIHSTVVDGQLIKATSVTHKSDCIVQEAQNTK